MKARLKVKNSLDEVQPTRIPGIAGNVFVANNEKGGVRYYSFFLEGILIRVQWVWLRLFLSRMKDQDRDLM